jgi:hypothetical protein
LLNLLPTLVPSPYPTRVESSKPMCSLISKGKSA